MAPRILVRQLEKRARKHGVIGVGEGFIALIPGSIEQFYIDQEPFAWSKADNVALCLTRERVVFLGSSRYSSGTYGQIDVMRNYPSQGFVQFAIFQPGGGYLELAWSPDNFMENLGPHLKFVAEQVKLPSNQESLRKNIRDHNARRSTTTD